MSNPVSEFNAYHSRMNEKILENPSKFFKRFFNLDTNAYQKGVLDRGIKELLVLVASMVLRCDDGVKYHLEGGFKANVSKAAVLELLEIATLVGGSIVIPHLRRAYPYWEALESNVQEK